MEREREPRNLCIVEEGKSICSNSWSYLDARGIAKYRKITTIIRHPHLFQYQKVDLRNTSKSIEDSISSSMLLLLVYIFIFLF